MPQKQFTIDDFVEVRIVEPGDDCNLYAYDLHGQGLRLTGVHRTSQPSPADCAVVPDTSPDGEDDLGVWLVSHRSLFPGCLVSARPIALLEAECNGRSLRQVIAVPAADETFLAVSAFEDLPRERQQALIAFAQAGLAGREYALRWGDAAHAHEAIHQARQAARQARAKAHKSGPAVPAWRPLGYRVAGATRASDAEPHTEAEHAYRQLPYRFQEYVDHYLAHNERILFAVNRPAMTSALKRTWLIRETLQEGILFITDQQVVLVTEVMPPGQWHMRYGYVVHAGIPERIESASVRPIGRHVGLELIWRARGGEQRVIWEFPAEAADELNQAVEILSGWQPADDDLRLRRAYGPEPVEMPLHDPAANDPQEVEPVARRLTEALQKELTEGEKVLARALLPLWVDGKAARVLAVTDRRAILLPDSPDGRRARPDVYLLERITSVEFTSSVIESWLAFNLVDGGGVRRAVWRIPNTTAAFRTCFTALRQQLTAVPVWTGG